MPKVNSQNIQKPSEPIVMATETTAATPNGSIKVYKITVFTDERTASAVKSWVNSKGKQPFKPSTSKAAFNIDIPVDFLPKFVQSAAFNAMTSAMAKGGYNITPDWFVTSVESGTSKAVNQDDYKALDTSYDKLMDDMLDHFEGKLNDPMVEKILESMKVYDPNTGEFKGIYEFLKKHILSAHNVIQVCAQWRNAQKGGVPTFVATKRQWYRDYNRYVVQNAVPMLMTTPNDQHKKSVSDAIVQNNLTRNQYRSNSHVKHGVHSEYYDNGQVSDFHGEYVYDITDTEVLPGMRDVFTEHEGLSSNLWPDQINQAAQDKGHTVDDIKSDNEKLKQIGLEANQDGQQKVLSALQVYVNENPKLGANIASAIKSGNIVNAVRAYFENEPYIDREKNPSVKNALLNMCVFAALNHYGVAPMNMLQAFQQARQYLVQNNKIPKQMRIKFMPFYRNFVEMVETNAPKAVKNESAEIRNTFASMWNRLVEINERGKDDVVF